MLLSMNLPTISPTISPTTAGKDQSNTLPQTASMISDLDNVTLLYIIFGVLFVFYIFICMYIWCNERRKRWFITDNFQKESEIDKQNRLEYMQRHQADIGYQVYEQEMQNGVGINNNGHGDVNEVGEYVKHDVNGYNAIPHNLSGAGVEIEQYDHQEALMNEGDGNFID